MVVNSPWPRWPGRFRKTGAASTTCGLADCRQYIKEEHMICVAVRASYYDCNYPPSAFGPVSS